MVENCFKKAAINPYKNLTDDEVRAAVVAKMDILKNNKNGLNEKNIVEAEKVALLDSIKDHNLIEFQRLEAKLTVEKQIYAAIRDSCVVRTNGNNAILEKKFNELTDVIQRKWGFKSVVEIELPKDIELFSDVGTNTLDRLLKTRDVEDIFQWINETSAEEFLKISKPIRIGPQTSYEDYKATLKEIRSNFIGKETAYKNWLKASTKVDPAQIPDRYKQNDAIITAGLAISSKAYDKYCTDFRLKNVYSKIEDSPVLLSCSEDVIKLIENMGNIGISKDVATTMIENYCICKGYHVVFKTVLNNMASCGYCNFTFINNGSYDHCPHCGKPLKVKCPKCSTEQESSNYVCLKCKFPIFNGIARIKALSEEFDLALKKGLSDQALKCITELESLDPNNSDLVKYKNRYEKYLIDFDQKMGVIQRMEANNEWMGILGKIESLTYIAPESIEVQQLSLKAKKYIQTAKDRLSRVPKNGSEQAVFIEYEEISKICGDIPELSIFFKSHPPQTPSKFTADIHGSAIRLSIEPSPKKENVTYLIIRGDLFVPNSVDDGVEIGRTTGTVLMDTKVKPGVDYYYTLFTYRCGIYANNITSGPACIYPAPIDAKISSMPDSILISGTMPEGCTDARIIRAGDKKSIECNISNGMLNAIDRDVSSSTKYVYALNAIYHKNGKEIPSDTITLNGTPVELPKPVKINCEKVNNTTFKISWAAGSNFKLYSSLEKKIFDTEYVKMNELKLKEMSVNTLTSNFVNVVLKDEVLFLYPVTISGALAIVGEPVFVSSVKEVDPMGYNINYEFCVISINPSKFTFENLEIFYSYTTMPDDKGTNCNSIVITKEVLNNERGIIKVPMNGNMIIFVRLCSIFKGGVRSPGLELCPGGKIVVNASISIKPIRFKKNEYKVNVSLLADKNEIIPKTTMIMNEFGTPKNVTDGTVVKTINAVKKKELDENIVVNSMANLNPSNFKLFLEDTDKVAFTVKMKS